MGFYGYSTTLSISVREESQAEGLRVAALNADLRRLEEEYTDLRLSVGGDLGDAAAYEP